jgi:hypothetical protein
MAGAVYAVESLLGGQVRDQGRDRRISVVGLPTGKPWIDRGTFFAASGIIELLALPQTA